MSNNEQSTGRKRVLQGKVVSNKPAGGKTVVVEVERRVLHPKYKNSFVVVQNTMRMMKTMNAILMMRF